MFSTSFTHWMEVNADDKSYAVLGPISADTMLLGVDFMFAVQGNSVTESYPIAVAAAVLHQRPRVLFGQLNTEVESLFLQGRALLCGGSGASGELAFPYVIVRVGTTNVARYRFDTPVFPPPGGMYVGLVMHNFDQVDGFDGEGVFSVRVGSVVPPKGVISAAAAVLGAAD